MVILGMAEGAIQLVPDGTIVLHIAFILVMVALLNRTLLRPIREILDARDKEVSTQLAAAKEIKNQVKSGSEKYLDSLMTARKHGYALLEETRNKGLREKEQALAEARERMDQEIEKRVRLIQEQGSAARSAIDSEVLARMIRDQVLRPLKGRETGN